MKYAIHQSTAALTATVVFGSICLATAAEASWWSTTPATEPTPPVAQQVAATASHDGTFTGAPYDAYWGLVQVAITIKNDHIVAIDVPQFPDHRRTSRSINDNALPRLERSVIKAQSTKVNLVSGATLTSQAYLRSLRSALKKAGY
jgi:uncharacterized protein with FMN-binding domain